jgi:hypothetical protein
MINEILSGAAALHSHATLSRATKAAAGFCEAQQVITKHRDYLNLTISQWQFKPIRFIATLAPGIEFSLYNARN